MVWHFAVCPDDSEWHINGILKQIIWRLSRGSEWYRLLFLNLATQNMKSEIVSERLKRFMLVAFSTESNTYFTVAVLCIVCAFLFIALVPGRTPLQLLNVPWWPTLCVGFKCFNQVSAHFYWCSLLVRLGQGLVTKRKKWMFALGRQLASGEKKSTVLNGEASLLQTAETIKYSAKLQMEIPACSIPITVPGRESAIVAFLRDDLPVEQLLLSPWWNLTCGSRIILPGAFMATNLFVYSFRARRINDSEGINS